MAKIKLHVQMEQFTGVKFDFIEVELTKVEQIETVYKSLETKYGKAQYVKSAHKGNGAIAPSAKQVKLINDLGGDATIQHGSWDELNAYIKTLFANKDKGAKTPSTPKAKPTYEPQTPPAHVGTQTQDVPWELDL